MEHIFTPEELSQPSPIENGQANGEPKKKPSLNTDAFYGRADHRGILQRLLSGIQEVNFHQVIGLEPDEDLTQKHLIVAVNKNLLDIAKQRQWNLCKAYDYTYIYNGACWKQCSKDDMKKFLGDAAIKMGVQDCDARYYDFKDKLLKQFLSDAYLPTPQPQPERVLINLLNGTFEFSNGGCHRRDFDPDDFLTYQLPFNYDAEATCPMFDKYLSHVIPDESSRIVLQEFAGFVFTKMNLEKCLVLLGTGGNGKSVFFNILNALVGQENTLNYSLGLFRHEYNRAKLIDVLLNYSSEKGFDLDPDTFKALVSGEPLQAREIYSKPFTLRNKVKFIINCNELPKETESTVAFHRRFLIVPMEVNISDDEKDIDLAKKIIDSELPGIFNWALCGMNRLRQQGDFSCSEKMERALADFRKQGDSVQLFIEERQYERCNVGYKLLNDLYKDYKQFCIDDGYRPLGKNNFSKKLESKGFAKDRKHDGTCFGITYKFF